MTMYEEMYTPEQKRYNALLSAIDRGTAYKEFGYDPNGFHKKEAEKNDLAYDAGVHTRMFRGSAAYVANTSDLFHKAMFKKYGARYRILNVNTVQLADSTAMYITFQV